MIRELKLVDYTFYRDTSKCLRLAGSMSVEHNHWVFVGDSRIRQLYFEVLRHMDSNGEPTIVENDTVGEYQFFTLKGTPSADDADENKSEDSRPVEKAHRSLTYANPQIALRLSFFWRPIFNASAVDLLIELRRSTNIPRVLVAGSGAWYIKLSNGSDTALSDYAKDIDLLAKVTIIIQTSNKSIPHKQYRFQSHVALYRHSKIGP